MPKTIDYPRTTYASAWEVAEVVDDTGGKCAIETCARKLSRKVSGSFKAIIGSAVKFGLVTSKRELLTTTNLFRRIKHAYDKQEEKIFHREAFLHPPLFNQICRKFRNRELPIHMLDVMLIREFSVEEINAQNVARAFIDGARMAGILDERNIIADIDQLAQQSPRQLASVEMPLNTFRPLPSPGTTDTKAVVPTTPGIPGIHNEPEQQPDVVPVPVAPMPPRTRDAVSSLFGLDTADLEDEAEPDLPTGEQLVRPSPAMLPDADSHPIPTPPQSMAERAVYTHTTHTIVPSLPAPGSANRPATSEPAPTAAFTVRITGPGIDSQLDIQDPDDLAIVNILLEKIRKQLTRQ